MFGCEACGSSCTWVAMTWPWAAMPNLSRGPCEYSNGLLGWPRLPRQQRGCLPDTNCTTLICPSWLSCPPPSHAVQASQQEPHHCPGAPRKPYGVRVRGVHHAHQAGEGQREVAILKQNESVLVRHSVLHTPNDQGQNGQDDHSACGCPKPVLPGHSPNRGWSNCEEGAQVAG